MWSSHEGAGDLRQLVPQLGDRLDQEVVAAPVGNASDQHEAEGIERNAMATTKALALILAGGSDADGRMHGAGPAPNPAG